MLAVLLQAWEVLTWSIIRGSMLNDATEDMQGRPLVPSYRRAGWDSEVTTMEGISDVSFVFSVCSDSILGWETE